MGFAASPAAKARDRTPHCCRAARGSRGQTTKMGERTARPRLLSAGGTMPAAVRAVAPRPCWEPQMPVPASMRPFSGAQSPQSLPPPRTPASHRSTLAWKLLRQTHPKKQGHCSLGAPFCSSFTPRQGSAALWGPPGGTAGARGSPGEWQISAALGKTQTVPGSWQRRETGGVTTSLTPKQRSRCGKTAELNHCPGAVS